MCGTASRLARPASLAGRWVQPCPLHARSSGQTRTLAVTHETNAGTATCISAALAGSSRSLPSWVPPSSLLDDLGHVLRVQAKPLRGRSASLDTVATAKGRQLRGGTGEELRETPSAARGHGRARYVPGRRSHRGQSRSLRGSVSADPQVSQCAGSGNAAPQTSHADSAGSIPVTRSTTKAQVTGGCVFRSAMMLACPLTLRCCAGSTTSAARRYRWPNSERW